MKLIETRQLSVSVQDLTKKLHQLMEENVVFQTELDEYRSGSQETIQRLKDELRGSLSSTLFPLFFD
jgi:hypothetical protein